MKKRRNLSDKPSTTIGSEDIQVGRDLTKTLGSALSARDLAKTLGSTLSARDLAKTLGSTLSARDLTKTLGSALSAPDLAKTLGSTLSARDQLKNMALLTRAVEAKKILGGTLSAREQITRLAEIDTVANAALTFGRRLSAREQMKHLTGFTTVSEAAKTLGSVPEVQKYFEHLAGFTTAAEAAKTLGIVAEAQNNANTFSADRLSATSSKALENAVGTLHRPEFISAIVKVLEKEIESGVAKQDIETSDVDDQDVTEALKLIASAEHENSLSEALKKCPSWLQTFFIQVVLFILVQIVVGIANNIAANLLTPHVEAYLKDIRGTTEREKIKNIKKLSFSEFGAELRTYRFVTIATLPLRTTPNSKAPKIGELRFGQVVGVVSTDRDWTEVVYEYGDGDTMTGWVFTRYIAKFRS
ncbi:MAG: SH3 domain-containing protein [Bacillota bacterium]